MSLAERKPGKLAELQNRQETSLQKLDKSIEQITGIALELGLDPFPTQFLVVPPEVIYEIGTYGIPGRFSHWTTGVDYYRQKTSYDYGASKIYELVVNTNPSLAYLLENNALIEQKLVVAHVLGHTDFFKNNRAFANTDRNMHETAALHADRIRGYEFEYGEQKVEHFLDAALSLEWNIDPFGSREWSREGYLAQNQQVFEDRRKRQDKEGAYEDLFELGKNKRPDTPNEKTPLPVNSERDLLAFIAAFSPKGLEDWQKDILHIIRDEARYFYPQGQTIIMNEGWAVFWHLRILRELAERDLLEPGEDIAWANMHSGVAVPSKQSINPYYVGWQVWEDIYQKYRGETDPRDERDQNWLGEEIDPSKYKGSDQYDIFRIREEVPSDEAFLQNFLTPALIKKLDLYEYGLEERSYYMHKYKIWAIQNTDPQRVKEGLISSMTNMKQPIIEVAPGGGDYNGSNELYLQHAWDGRELDINWTTRTLQHVHRLWGKPVYLETQRANAEKKEEETVLFSYDGKTSTMLGKK